MKKLILKAAIFLALISPFLGSASASLEIGYPLDTNFLCESQSIVVNVVLKNNFDVPLIVSWSKESVPRDLLVDSPKKSILLLPNSSENLPLVITPQGNEYGEKNFNIAIISENFTRTIQVKVFLKNCHDISVNVENLSKDVCLFTSDEFEIIVNNTGLYDEVLSVKLSGDGTNYVKLSREGGNALVIPKNDSRKLFLFVYPSGPAGDFKMVVDIYNDKIQKSIPLQVRFSKCNDFSVSIPSSVEVCENSKQSINITVLNLGVNEDEYRIFLKGPPGLLLSNSSVPLAANNSYNIGLAIPPDCEEYGIYFADVFLESKNSGLQKNESLKMVVDNCYNFEMDYSGSGSLCACDEYNGNLSIFNNGKYAQEYIFAETSDYLELKADTITLDPNSSAVVPFSFRSCEEGVYSFPVIVTDNSSCHTKKVRNVEFVVLPTNKCVRASVEPAQETYTLSSLAQYNIPVIIKNMGVQVSDYSFEFAGSAGSWVYAQTKDSFALEPNSLEKVNFLVVPPQNLSDNSYELVVNVFSKGVLSGSGKIIFSKDKKSSPIVSYVVMDRENAELSYLLLILLVLFLVLILNNRRRLASFLRKQNAQDTYEKDA